MQAALEAGASWPGAVAVSGGGDSTALMVLIGEWAAAAARPPPMILTVDHGLHRESSRHAAAVAAQAARIGLGVQVLVWRGPRPVADIEGVARTVRFGLMGDWCRSRQMGSLYLAHALEDQAETFLLRLARGSGLDGLAAMAVVADFPLPEHGGPTIIRPLLDVPRARLRATLQVRGLSWSEDPMNADPRFARVRLRMAWPEFGRLGLSAARIAAASRHIARARVAFDHEMRAFLERASRNDDHGVLLDGAGLAAIPEEIGLRTLATVLMRVSGEPYRPRIVRLERLMAAIRSDTLGKGRTLHGCWIKPAAPRERRFGPQTLRIVPEPARRRLVANRRVPAAGKNPDVKIDGKRELPRAEKNS